MKCINCGVEIIEQPGKNIRFCPFCGCGIEADNTNNTRFFDNTKDLLAYIAAEYGAEALFAGNHLSDHISPSMSPGQKNLVKQAFECGAVKILQDSINADRQDKANAAKSAVDKLIDIYASANEAAERVIGEFTDAIGWDIGEPANARLEAYIQTIYDQVDSEKKAAEDAKAESQKKAEEDAAREKRAHDAFNDACKRFTAAKDDDELREAITVLKNIDPSVQSLHEARKMLIDMGEKGIARREDHAAFKEAIHNNTLVDYYNNLFSKNETRTERPRDYYEHYYWVKTCDRLKNEYEMKKKKRDLQVDIINNTAKIWMLARKCHHCGGDLKGIITKICGKCGKSPSEPLAYPPEPQPPVYPPEPVSFHKRKKS